MAAPISVKKFWNTGDTITADKLTQMGVLTYATVDENTDLTLDITWQEAYDSIITGIVVNTERENMRMRDYFNVFQIIGDSGQNTYTIAAQTPGGSIIDFTCSSPNGYPTTRKEEDGSEKK